MGANPEQSNFDPKSQLQIINEKLEKDPNNPDYQKAKIHLEGIIAKNEAKKSPQLPLNPEQEREIQTVEYQKQEAKIGIQNECISGRCDLANELGGNYDKQAMQLKNLRAQLNGALGGKKAYLENEIDKLVGQNYTNLPDGKGFIDNKEHFTYNFKQEYFEGIPISPEEMLNFSAMIQAEALGETEKGIQAVAFAILNRLKSGDLSLGAGNMNNVLFLPGQFNPVSDGRFNNILNKGVNPEIMEIAIKTVRGQIKNPIGNRTFFQTVGADNTAAGERQKKHKRNPLKIGNHIFRG